MTSKVRDITIRQLRSLAAVAKGGSITAAARRLNLTQPAITLQLANLQNLADLPLIQRSGNTMLLTDAGRELLRLAERIEAAIGDCAEALDVMSGRSGGRVTIGAVSTAKYFVPFVISAYSRLHPDVQVVLSIGNRQEIMQALRGYDLDFAIMGRPPPDIAVEQHLIGDHPHVVIASASHRLAGRQNLSVADLTEEVFLAREVGSGTRMLMERFFEDASVAARPTMEFNSNESIKQSVIAGLGIAFLSAHTVSTELDDGRLVVLDVVGSPVIRQWFIIKRADKVLLPAAQSAFAFMIGEAQQLDLRTGLGQWRRRAG